MNASFKNTSMIILRSHYFDEDIHATYRKFEQMGWNIVISMNEYEGEVDTPDGVRKISLTPEFISANKLRMSRDYGWRCGDYVFYATRQQYPDYEHYWVIEPDLIINSGNQDHVLKQMDAESDADFLACYLTTAKKKWYWYDSIKEFYPTPWKCMFPIGRLSGRAIDFLLSQRRIMSENFRLDDSEDRNWPIDEAFMASALANNGFKIADLNSLGRRYYRHDTLTYHFPVSRCLLGKGTPDDLIYHPVLSGEFFKSKAYRLLEVAEKNGRLSGFQMFNARFFRSFAAECSAGEVDIFRSRMRAELRRRGISKWEQRMDLGLRLVASFAGIYTL